MTPALSTETFDGVTVDRRVLGLSTWRQFGAGAFGSGGNVTVTDFTVVILVDSDGLARQTAWTLTGETDNAKRSQSSGATRSPTSGRLTFQTRTGLQRPVSASTATT